MKRHHSSSHNRSLRRDAQPPQNGHGHGPPARLNGDDQRPVLITGGAGFVGTNMALRLLQGGYRVILFDNLSRPGVRHNARTLLTAFPGRAELITGDVRETPVLHRLIKEAQAVFHFAAQVAVTTSLEDPATDFETNLRGTFNVLEGQRACSPPPPVLFTSTNKVYGQLDAVASAPMAIGTTLWIRNCVRRAYPKGRSTSTAPTVAPKVGRTNTCSIMRGPTTFPISSFE